jgi:hypothetical protein
MKASLLSLKTRFTWNISRNVLSFWRGDHANWMGIMCVMFHVEHLWKVSGSRNVSRGTFKLTTLDDVSRETLLGRLTSESVSRGTFSRAILLQCFTWNTTEPPAKVPLRLDLLCFTWNTFGGSRVRGMFHVEHHGTSR